MIKLGKKHIALLLVVCATLVIQSSPAVRAAGPHRIMVPVAIQNACVGRAVPTDTRWSLIEREAVAEINCRRQAVQCPPLILNQQLTVAADRHSKDMAAGNFLSHTGSDKSTAEQRIVAAGYYPSRKIGENLAVGYPTAEMVVQAWYDSPGHKANMLDCAFRDTGISLEINNATQWKYFWTNTFGVK